VQPVDLARSLTMWVRTVRVFLSSESERSKWLLEVPFDRGDWSHA